MQPATATEQYRRQAAIAGLTAGAVSQLWQRMGDDFDLSWASVGPRVLEAVESGRRATVTTALSYTGAVLEETAQDAPPVGALNAAAFLATAPDGRPMDTLLAESVIKVKSTIANSGATTSEALAVGGRWLTRATLTTLADTRREVYGADIIRRPAITGYVRMLNPPSCKDCIILAGRWYRWNAGFQRHPNCDCIHIPAAENVANDLRTDPYAVFRRMSAAEQDRTFGRIEARAIRDGADIYRVVNTSNRGLATVKGAAKFGSPTRVTIDDIYRRAGTRANAIRMMQENGYITGPQVAGGNILGNGPSTAGFGQLGRGGTRRAASDAAVAANAAGVRDPLNRYTMTAAERRLYDAHYRLEQARRTGFVPRSIGFNSADRYATPIRATPEKIAELEQALQRQIAVLDRRSTPESVRRVARALGLL